MEPASTPVCTQCGNSSFKRIGPGNFSMIFWRLNPGLAINELLLGQRVAAEYYECLGCELPRIRRTYAHCRNCGITFNPIHAKPSDGFGHWFGLYCPNCGTERPTLRNYTTLLLSWLTFPFWYFPV